MPGIGLGIAIGANRSGITFQYLPVIESVARLANRTISFTGNVIECGPGKTYTTITAAYNAASSGDIIQLSDGIYSTNAEAGGYLLINTTGKRILIRGNANDNTACIIEQASAASYCTRLRDCGETIFQNLTIRTNQANAALYYDSAGYSRILVVDNCKIYTTNTAAGGSALGTISVAIDSLERWIEIKNSEISGYSGNTDAPIKSILAGDKTTYLITDSTINGADTNAYTFNVIGGSTCKVHLYDSNFIQYGPNYNVKIGHDIAASAVNVGYIDIRSCTLDMKGDPVHNLLIGRGTNQYYIVNNKIYNLDTDSTVNLGAVIKTVASNMADTYFAGNYVYAPIPIYIKGGKFNDIESNVAVSNRTDKYAIRLGNAIEDVELLCESNDIKNNKFYSKHIQMQLLTAGASQTAKVGAAKGNINDNRYFTELGEYLENDTVDVAFADRGTFWDEDVSSYLKRNIPMPQKN